MGMKSWEWEGMGTQKSFPHISTPYAVFAKEPELKVDGTQHFENQTRMANKVVYKNKTAISRGRSWKRGNSGQQDRLHGVDNSMTCLDRIL